MGWEGYDVWLGTEHEPSCAAWAGSSCAASPPTGWEIGSHT